MQGALIVLAVLAGLALFVLLWAVITYNRLVSLRAHIKDAWAGVSVELKRRYDLIPNLVETVKAYAAHERETLERVVQARARAMDNHGPADAQARDEQQLAGALRRLNAVAEAYPDLKADRHFLDLQHQLTETEDRIAAARRFYNGNVRTLNTLTQVIPSNIIAHLAGFSAQPYFELDDPAEANPPAVRLND
jgi:LemA protein